MFGLVGIVTIHIAKKALLAHQTSASTYGELLTAAIANASECPVECYTWTVLVPELIEGADVYIEVDGNARFVQLGSSADTGKFQLDGKLIEAHQQKLQGILDNMKVAFNLKFRLVLRSELHTFVVTSSP